MSKTNVITARIDDQLLADIDRLGDLHERSRAWLVTKAIKAFVDEEMAFLASLDEADKAIDRGEFHSQEEMEAWVSSLHVRDKAA